MIVNLYYSKSELSKLRNLRSKSQSNIKKLSKRHKKEIYTTAELYKLLHIIIIYFKEV